MIYMNPENIEKILLCYICKKHIESDMANFDLINNVAVHINPRLGISHKFKRIFKGSQIGDDCTIKYIKTISATGREISFKEVKIDDIFRHCRELFVIINEQEELPPEKKTA